MTLSQSPKSSLGLLGPRGQRPCGRGSPVRRPLPRHGVACPSQRCLKNSGRGQCTGRCGGRKRPAAKGRGPQARGKPLGSRNTAALHREAQHRAGGAPTDSGRFLFSTLVSFPDPHQRVKDLEAEGPHFLKKWWLPLPTLAQQGVSRASEKEPLSQPLCCPPACLRAGRRTSLHCWPWRQLPSYRAAVSYLILPPGVRDLGHQALQGEEAKGPAGVPAGHPEAAPNPRSRRTGGCSPEETPWW